MIPASPHKVTIGTGERRIRATVVFSDVGQPSSAPSGVLDQSKVEIVPAIWPPFARKDAFSGEFIRRLRLLGRDRVYSRKPGRDSANGNVRCRTRLQDATVRFVCTGEPATFPRAMGDLSPSGVSAIPHLTWGSHLTHFFEAADELRDLLVPYFKAGLGNNEACFWVTGKDFTAAQARAALREAVPELDHFERTKQIEICDAEDFYSPEDKLSPENLIGDLIERER